MNLNFLKVNSSMSLEWINTHERLMFHHLNAVVFYEYNYAWMGINGLSEFGFMNKHR